MQSFSCLKKTTNTALRTHQDACTPSMFKWDTTCQLIVCYSWQWCMGEKWTERAGRHPPIALSSSHPNIVQPLLIGNEKQMVPSISFYETGK